MRTFNERLRYMRWNPRHMKCGWDAIVLYRGVQTDGTRRGPPTREIRIRSLQELDQILGEDRARDKIIRIELHPLDDPATESDDMPVEVAVVLGVGALAVNAMHRAAPTFKAECHASGGWAYMSPAGHYEGCIFPPPKAQ